MEQSFFYIAGLTLTVLAVVLSFVGLRREKFPPSRAVLLGGVAAFALVVVATAAGAVINARDEQEHREHELAEEEAAAVETEQEEAATAEETGGEGPAGAGQQGADQAEEQAAAGGSGAEDVLELSSPEDGSLSFDPAELEASAGSVALEYTNPSPVQHNVAVEQDGKVLAEGELVADGDVSTASADLEPGEYVYFCSVPGHREGGMEGALTVE